MSTLTLLDQEGIGLNRPGFIYLNEHVLMNVRQATGDAGEGTIDELKFGPLFVRISDTLFPWCSTLTTRARYFFFTYAVLQLALERTVPLESRDPQRDGREAEALAWKRRLTFVHHVRRIEKYLTLALYLRGDTDGTFGKRRANRWLYDEDGRYAVSANSYAKILSADSRYANVIYRGVAKRLGMFIGPSSNRALIAAHLRGVPAFTSEWVVAGAAALAELRDVTAFWERYDTPLPNSAAANASLHDVALAFAESAAARAFAGFTLSGAETDFLFRKIQTLTPYWAEVSLEKLKELYALPVSVADLRTVFAGTPADGYLETAHHIDVATRYWSQHYGRIADRGGRTVPLDAISKALDEIRYSISWLDAAAEDSDNSADWADAWRDSYSALVDGWVEIAARGDATGLANELMARAEEVMRERGRGKIAPHKRLRGGDDEADLRTELDLSTIGFRFDNANRLLADIASGEERV